jgi:hypothetical protein
MTLDRGLSILPQMSPGARLATMIWCAIALAGLTVAGLNALHRPSGYQARLALLQNRVDQIEHLRERAKGDKPAGLGTICAQDVRTAAPLLTAAIRSVAARAKVSLANLAVTPAASAGRNLATLSVQMQAAGGYGPTLSLLQDLQSVRPALVLDSVDLVPRSDTLHLELSGRAYCWTHAPL